MADRRRDAGKSPKRSWHKEAFLAMKSWSKRLHRRSSNRLKDASLSSSTSTVTYDEAVDRSQTSEADSLSREYSQYDVLSKQHSKEWHTRLGSSAVS
ncbi:hypothetical protein WJX75_006603 [Coccomyxa subellipsoidea]|uniref:DUF4005 domain-containing protein n=1 Tax=Coccomyxa subellipsoidea TaxID=248742 RepID=A0ABR2YWD6_9CHLO